MVVDNVSTVDESAIQLLALVTVFRFVEEAVNGSEEMLFLYFQMQKYMISMSYWFDKS